MPKHVATRLQTFAGVIRHLLPAWLFFALAAVLDHPLCLVLLLVANALTLTGICHALGFDMEAGFWRSVARRGVTYFVLLTAYTAFVAAVLVAPAWWLLREGSFVAALGMSAAVVVSLLALWRIWPAFALPLLWDDAYPNDEEPGSWLLTALRRSSAFARHLTRENDLFFGCGLPASMGLLLLAIGALTLAAAGHFIGDEVRIAALALYALVIAPLAHVVLVNRSLSALLANARSTRRRRRARPLEPGTAPDSSVAEEHLTTTATAAELDATLLCAAHSAQISLALAALERGADPNAVPAPQQRDQRSALMIAVSMPDLRLLRALIAKGVDVNNAASGSTALIAATRDSHEGRSEAVTTLLANGADPRVGDASGSTPLHHAMGGIDPAIAALLLDAGAAVDALNANGVTALGMACAQARWNLAAFLLERSASVDVAAAQPALLAAAGGTEDDPSGVKLLLKHRADIDARDALQRTALMAAALAGHARIVETLLAAGATVDLADNRGTTALMEAARSGCVSAIHALGRRKAKVDTADRAGRSALIIACQSRHASEECVRALLSLGADRAYAGSDGKRALDHAAAAGRWHIVALLDPAYTLPSSLGGAQALTASADHLLDALRFGHWPLAEEFVALVADWPPSTLADLYVDLADAEHAAARDWLCNHGLAADAAVSDGRALIDALSADLPATCVALEELLARGAAVGGAARVARTLVHALAGEAGAPIRRLVHALIERGGDCGGSAAGLRTPLHLAVACVDLALASRLLDLGADPNACDAQGATALHVAVQLDAGRAIPLLQALLRAGGSAQIANVHGETALGIALTRTEPDFVYWLNWMPWPLPQRRLRDGDLPAAAKAGDLEAVERLLALGLALDSEDAQGATALIRAAGSGHAALVVRLLELGADAAHVAHSGIHCLAAAVAAKREAVVRTLLSHGIAADTRMTGGGTALIVAAALGELAVAEALLEAGADVAAVDAQGTTALHAAAQFAFERGDAAVAHSMLKCLLDQGARLDARNQVGQDPLLVLLGAPAQPGAHCDAEMLRHLAEYLLERGARPDTQDARGVGPLHACALHGLFGCARLLKAHGAPGDQCDSFGRSAADVATLLGYVDVAVELGANRNPVPSVRQTLRRPARTPD